MEEKQQPLDSFPISLRSPRYPQHFTGVCRRVFLCRTYSSQLSLENFFENSLKFFKFRQLSHMTTPVLFLPLYNGI